MSSCLFDGSDVWFEAVDNAGRSAVAHVTRVFNMEGVQYIVWYCDGHIECHRSYPFRNGFGY